MRRAIVSAAISALLTACGGDDSTLGKAPDAGAGGCPPGSRLGDAGACLAAGTQDNGCPAGEVALQAGGCRPAGIPPELCAAGFAADDDGGCSAILPAQPCAPGSMAIPGETSCREVAPCANGTWGDIPVDANTVHVDGSYAGGSSDGTAARPWTTIQAAVDAAQADAIVAIAAGSYPEDIEIDKAVRLWGRCPALVTIVGTGAGLGAVDVMPGAAGTEVHDLAVGGAGSGIAIAAEQVAIDRVWIASTGLYAIDAEDALGPVSFALRRSLIESATAFGIFAGGVDATIEATVVRDTRPAPDQSSGEGIVAEDDRATSQPSTLTLRSSVFERNREVGILVVGSDATIEATVARDTQPRAADGSFGRGIDFEADGPVGLLVSGTIRSCVAERNHEAGVAVAGGTVLVEGTVARDTLPQPSDQNFGDGITILADPTTGARGSVTVRSCLVASNTGGGVFVGGGDATIEGTSIVDTHPQASDESFGDGIAMQDDRKTGQRPVAIVRSSVVERSAWVGIFVGGADATIEGTAVRDTAPQLSDHAFGRGIVVQNDPVSGAHASASIRGSVIDRSSDCGVFVVDADATIDASVIDHTLPRASDGTFGDGLVAWSYTGPSSLMVTASRIASSSRAGIASFGGKASIGSTALECDAISLDGELGNGDSASWEDRGLNACSCDGVASACRVLSSQLDPPPAAPQKPIPP